MTRKRKEKQKNKTRKLLYVNISSKCVINLLDLEISKGFLIKGKN